MLYDKQNWMGTGGIRRASNCCVLCGASIKKAAAPKHSDTFAKTPVIIKAFILEPGKKLNYLGNNLIGSEIMSGKLNSLRSYFASKWL
ncbi:MAG TPA: hypothetical protein PKU80_11140 [Candidatus Limiplasma sp.]|nr:hypothetical protein [Candidatus Limiplasma sp.]